LIFAVAPWKWQIGVTDFKNEDHFCPPVFGHMTRRAQWPFQLMVMWSDWVTHNSGMDYRRVLKIGVCVSVCVCVCVCACWMRQALNLSDTAKVKRSKVKVTRSYEIVHKTSNIWRKRHRTVEIYPSYRKSRSPERLAGSDIWPEAPKQPFLRRRSENMSNSLLTTYHIIKILSPL